MAVLLFASVLVSLLSFSSAAPTADNCSQPLTVKELDKILGKWVFIEGVSNNDLFDSVLMNTESLWIKIKTTADNRTLVLEQANRLVPQPHLQQEDRCLQFAPNLTFINDEIIDVHLKVAATNHRFLHSCSDCLLMYTYTNENNYTSLYLFGRNTTLEASDMETFRKQATCFQFPLPAKFQYDPSKGSWCLLLGRNKIQDAWDQVVYEIMQCLDYKGKVYKIRPRNGAGPEKNINRAELKVLPPTVTVGSSDSLPPELHNSPQENDNDIETSGEGSEMGSLIMIQLWDTAGQERFRKSMVQHYYRNVHAVVYDVTNAASFRSLPAWMEVPRILVGNKCDLQASIQVGTDVVQQFADVYSMPVFETSAKNPN
ncbi:Ras-related protein Rab-33B [Nibea albiflora]|uniref:Ras-related protein Rab-33B n=1 Tax=Nibea albiflora TaxID=240163 RepID=A0ACB7ENS2_NIBAL|nr:Ras-related protein Rab-33B [Nibea albiflora]